MRYSLEPTYRRYVKGYGFLSFARKIGGKYGKKLMNTAVNTKNMYGKKIMEIAKKQGTNFAETAGKKNSSKKCRNYWRFDWK